MACCVFVYAMFSPVYLLSWPCASCYLVIGSVALPVSASLHSLQSLFSCCCQLIQVNYFCVFALFCFIFPIMGLLLSHHVWLLSGLLVNFFLSVLDFVNKYPYLISPGCSTFGFCLQIVTSQALSHKPKTRIWLVNMMLFQYQNECHFLNFDMSSFFFLSFFNAVCHIFQYSLYSPFTGKSAPYYLILV